MYGELEQYKYYPSPQEINDWILTLWEAAQASPCSGNIRENKIKYALPHDPNLYHTLYESHFVEFRSEGMPEFYGYWQPAASSPAPLIVNIPGYGAGISAYPEIVAQGFNVLHISPLGYFTPDGEVAEKKRGMASFPTLYDTMCSGGERGYKDWFVNCIQAIKWAFSQQDVLKDRVSFFGSSQGGGSALILGSIYKGKGARCVAADVPFLTNFPLADYEMIRGLMDQIDDKATAWRGLGFIDTICHAKRLELPVLLTAGGRDASCSYQSVESLFRMLPKTKNYTFLHNGEHRYSFEMVQLASAWFRLYA